jgi:hypothetical protein
MCQDTPYSACSAWGMGQLVSGLYGMESQGKGEASLSAANGANHL